MSYSVTTENRIRELLTRRKALQLGAASTILGLGPRIARADTYPSGPITVIIPLPPGSVLDTIARQSSDHFRADFNAPFVVENFPGAAGNLGAARAAHAKPDGMTVLMTVSSPVSTNEFVYKQMPFNPEKDLAPVILTGTAPITLVVHSSFPAHSVQEYIDYARAHPGEVAYGSSGVGSPQHLCAEYMASLTGIKLTHIPFSGTPQSALDVIAGHIPSAFTSFALVVEQAKAGTVRILAIADDDRMKIAPDIPTIRETVPQFMHAPGAWQAMLVPAHTPDDVITILNREMNVVLSDPKVVQILQSQYVFPLGGTPQDLVDKIKYEQDIARVLVKKIGLVPL